MPLYQFLCSRCQHRQGFFEKTFLSETEIRDYMNTAQCFKCGGILERAFASFFIIGGEWDWKKGYRTGINDSAREIRYDLMKLEQSATEEGNLKKSNEKKQALVHFAEAHQDILEKADLK